MKAKLFTAVFGVLAFGFTGYGVTNYMAARGSLWQSAAEGERFGR